MHTVERLTAGYHLFPKQMTKSQPVLEDLTRQALRNHQGLRGVPADHAQLLYISEAAQAEGYAEEYFPGRVSCIFGLNYNGLHS